VIQDLPIGGLAAAHDVGMSDGVHGRIITAAARAALGPLGLRQKGRSRLWFDDHGWWLINVEFQPSNWAKGCYLNVGEQHLWCEGDYFVFDRSERPLGGATFVEFTGDETTFDAEIRRLAELAAATVQARRREHGSGGDALRFVARTGDDFDAGVALGLLGDAPAAAHRLQGRIHQAFREQADRYCSCLADGSFESVARAKVDRTRSRMKLPPTDWSWSS
jgi:hypothetical protein